MMEQLRIALGIVTSNLTAMFTKLNHRWLNSITPVSRYHGRDRRRNPRHCPICHGPMRADKRPPRDVRSLDGKIRRMPEEKLEWFACTRCHRSQIGVPALKLANGGRLG